MADELGMVWDCGATNLTVAAVDAAGRIRASAGRPNGPVPQPGAPDDWRIWDLDGVWASLCEASREVCGQVDRTGIKAVIVTTWGADGAPVKRDGTLTHPPIAWLCPRTAPLTDRIVEQVPARDLFMKTGYQVISFNTLLRWMWLRENEPEALDQADGWLMMSGLLNQRLCGEMSIDPTAASTAMAMDSGRRDWSPELLALAGMDASCFPEWVQPGRVIELITPQAVEATGLPSGTAVVAGGHDTQFALVGSGARPEEAILSTGTWEIATIRVDRFEPNDVGFSEGLIIEADCLPGLWDPQMLMMGSGVLEWLGKGFYADAGEGECLYALMIEEAEKAGPGAGGVTLVPSFVGDTGPTAKHGTLGTVTGLTLNTTRGDLYRAGLEGLSFQLKDALRILSEATGFTPAGLRVVGGGSKNPLWNRIRADVTGLPVTVTEQKEATVLGAGIMALVGAGVFASPEEAVASIEFGQRTVEPGTDAPGYAELWPRYAQLPGLLKPHFGVN